MFRSTHRRIEGFTIVEVMMAAVILVVGFMGMITALTLGSEMMATARRQTLANQILTHEIEKLRLSSWSTVSGLATASTTVTVDAQFTNAIAACGLTSSDLTLTRTAADFTTDLREVTFTLTWSKSGTSTAAATPTGTWLNQLAFYRPSSIARTYTRKMSAYIGKYGLSINAQR
jgi:Tfp pilus assembly protein PilV